MSSHQTDSKNHHVYMVDSSKHLFSHQEILTGTEKFLERVGYKLFPKSQAYVSPLDIHAQRFEGNENFEIFGMVCTGLEQAADGYNRLAAIQITSGKEADYVLVMPPINEYPIIQFFTADKGKWFYEIKKLRFMMWLCNPERNTLSCIVGVPRDRLLGSYFLHGYHPIDQYISTLLSRELMKDGDF